MHGGSSLLGVYDSLSGTMIALICKKISIWLASGISGGGGGSDGSSSQIIRSFNLLRRECSIQIALFYHNPDGTERVQTSYISQFWLVCSS